MKAGLVFLLAVVSAIVLISRGIYVSYRYSNDVTSYWSLADKASTIEQKAHYINIFVEKLESVGLDGKHSRIIFKTPDNSFDNNLFALKSFQMRLHEIMGMDIKSFEYQTALQQITGQEQGEAGEMLSVFRSTYMLHNYPMMWGWFLGIWIFITLCGMFISFAVWVD
jgi:hypothetical protein